MEELIRDERFAHIPRDPTFKRIPKRERKVKIDKRFQSMFNDKKFKVKYTVDKRGRPIQNSSTENLRRYYSLDTSEESDEASNDEDVKAEDVNLKVKKKEQGVRKETKREGTELVLSNIKNKSEHSKKEKYGKLQKVSNLSIVSNEDSNLTENFHADEDEDSVNDSDSDFEAGIDNDKLVKENKAIDAKVRARLQDMTIDYARGEGVLLSDSSSDEESSEEEDEDELEHGWGQLEQDAERTDESTHRLAVCHMDWDRINATDLMVLFNSFLPKGGVIHSITIYPSEYGLQRMKEEEEKGPLELRGESKAIVDGSDTDDEKKKKKRNQRDDEEVVEGDEYQREKLRLYQLNRLRYYYAVVVCDSVSTADSLYKECDGMEYESSASKLDLRFIPDDTTFDQEPKETCTELPNLSKYEPHLFITTALQQSKVRLTWDETDPRRMDFNKKLNSGKIDEIDDKSLKVYVATSSSEGESSGDEKEDDEKKKSASKYRALLESIESQEAAKRDKDMELEVKWGIDLKDKVQEKLKGNKEEELTPFQKYLLKRKEKRKAKREEQLRKKELQNQGIEGNEDDDNDVPSDIDMNDEYFKEEFEKEEFAHIKKDSKKKIKKKKSEESEDEELKKKKAELELLLMDMEDDNKKHFNLKDILVDETKNKKKGKNKRKEEDTEKIDDFQINVQDKRFSALFTSHHYNIDPADPHYKKTKAMEALRQEKLNWRSTNEEVPLKKQKVECLDEKKEDLELSLLVKNVKQKTQILKR